MTRATDPPLTIEEILRLHGEIQRKALRDALGDRLLVSRWVPPGESYVFMPGKLSLDRSIEDPVERAADGLRRGGRLIVNQEWWEGR